MITTTRISKVVLQITSKTCAGMYTCARAHTHTHTHTLILDNLSFFMPKLVEVYFLFEADITINYVYIMEFIKTSRCFYKNMPIHFAWESPESPSDPNVWNLYSAHASLISLDGQEHNYDSQVKKIRL